MASRATWLVLGWMMAAGCSGSDQGGMNPEPDGGMDAVVDLGGVDTGVDAGMDAAMDAGGDDAADGAVDVCPDALSDGNCLMCSPGQRVCDGACVGPTDPAHGCADPSCTPCAIPHATAVCGDAGRCVMGACEAGYTDCNHDPSDGCETATGTDPHNCGSCGRMCSVANATAGCMMGMCTVGTCNAGFGDCDMNPMNGCELPTSADVNNCGMCGNHCNLAHATAGCAMGMCTVTSCDTGFG